MSKGKRMGILLVGGTGLLTSLVSWLFLQREIGTFSHNQLAEDILHLFGFYQGLYVVPLIIYFKNRNKEFTKGLGIGLVGVVVLNVGWIGYLLWDLHVNGFRLMF